MKQLIPLEKSGSPKRTTSSQTVHYIRGKIISRISHEKSETDGTPIFQKVKTTPNFLHVLLGNLLMPPIAGLEKLTLWLSHDADEHYLYVDPATITPVLQLDLDGRIKFLNNPATSWEWVQQAPIDKMKEITLLDSDVFILQANSNDVPRPMLMQFPHLQDEKRKHTGI